MESSRYNIYIEDYPRNGYILIYNLYTRQIACVKERDPEKWSEVLFRKMKSKGFVVSSRVDELNQVLQSYINEATDSDELTIMLILTRRCNCNAYTVMKNNSILNSVNSIMLTPYAKTF